MHTPRRFSALAAFAAALALLGQCVDEPTEPPDATGNTPSGVNIPVVNVSSWTDNQIDSLFNLLVSRVQSLESVETYAQYAGVDFVSLRDGFYNYVGKYPSHAKANAGFIVSAVFAMNTSPQVRALADTMDSYFTAIDDYYYGGMQKGARRSTTFRSAAARDGVLGLGRYLLARAPRHFMAVAQRPNFPNMVTMNYIQTAVETEIVPMVGEMIKACERLEAAPSTAIAVEVEGETYDIDVSDVYVVDAGLRLVRGGMYLYTCYDYDMYTSAGDQTYSWINQAIDLADQPQGSDTTVYALSNDTLYETHIWAEGMTVEKHLAQVVKYNLGRPAFLALRRSHHSKAHEDLLDVPALIKKAIESARAERDAQDNDIFSGDALMEIDAEMFDMKASVLSEGVSPALANRFQTPETLMDFVVELLTGPVTFEETIDGSRIDMTVDLSAFFETPPADLRSLLPLYAWRPESEWYSGSSETHTYPQHSYADSSCFSYSASTGSMVKLEIDPTFIKSIAGSQWGDTTVCLQTSVGWRTQSSTYWEFMPLDLVDETGKVIDVESEIDRSTFFPYFRDYTFGGVFPGMTRQRWIDLIYQ